MLAAKVLCFMKVLKVLKMSRYYLSILPLLQAQLLFLRWEQDRYYAPLCCPDTPYIYIRPYLALAFIDAIQGSFIPLQKNYFVIWLGTCRT